MSDLIDKTLGKYRVVARLGQGGMAEVYKAYQPGLERYVAAKVLHSHLAEEQDFIGRFEREATAVARLRHPNVVQVYDFDHEGDLYYMVMEYVEGPTLKAELQERNARGQTFTLQETARIFNALASVVDYAHSRGMIHRDLKPANIMFTAEGQVVLTDFGIARIMGAARYTATGATLGTPAYMSPEQCRGEQGDGCSDIYSLGVILFEMMTGRVPFEAETPISVILKHISDPLPLPTAINPAVPEAVEQVILKATSKNPDDRYQTASEMAQALAEAVGITAESMPAGLVITAIALTPRPEVKVACPYRGLFAFHEEDAPFFFGREDFTDRLVEAAYEKSMIAVIGPSGSGKSSVVYAGLLPRLRQGASLRQAQGRAWAIADFRPGSRPFYALAAALLPMLEGPMSETDRLVEIRKLAESLSRGDICLYDVAERILQKSPGAGRLLLVVDQFEELYTLCPESEVQQRFLDMLLEATTTKERVGARPSSFKVALTLRADFMGQALTHRSFADALQGAALILGPMMHQELGRAIENPAHKRGVAFEPGLVKRILDDVSNEPGYLPLLEFALTTLWDQQEGRKLTHAAYEAIGRVEGALARYADEVYEGLSQAEQEGARRILVQMVRPGEGTEDTRRLATRTELGESNWPLVQRLAEARLVVTDRDPAGQETVEIVHEALIRSWERLREWMNADRAFRAWQERLRAALCQWETSSRDEGGLLRGAPLAEAEAWQAERAGELSQAETAFIQAGLALREREATEHEAQRQHELEAARKLAEETEARRRAETERAREAERSAARLRTRNRIVTAVGAVAVVAAIIAVWFVIQTAQQRDAAQRQARIALSRQLAAQTLGHLDDQYDLALLLSLESDRIASSAEARGSLFTALEYSPRLTTFLRGHLENVQSVAFSPDGKTLASGSGDKTIILWDVPTSKPLGLPLVGHMADVASVAFSPDGKTLASGGYDGIIILWNIATGKPLGQPLTAESGVYSIAFSPDGKTLASGGDGNTLTLWDVATHKPLGQPLAGHGGGVVSVAFSPDGKTLASGSNDKTIRLWDVATQQPLGQPLTGHQAPLYEVAFSPDGKTLASGGEDKTVILWDVTQRQSRGRPLTGHRGIVTSVAFSPDGKTLASGSFDQTIILWDVVTGKLLDRPLTGQGSAVLTVAFSPDGKTLASGSYDKTIVLWNVSISNLLGRPLIGHTNSVLSAAFSPDGKTLVSGSVDKTITLWDVATGQPIGSTPLTGHKSNVCSVTFSQDGKMLASGSLDKTILLWDVATGKPLGQPLIDHTDCVSSMAFSPDGKTLAFGSDDRTVILWDIAARQRIGQPLTGHTAGEISVAFSPDGKTLASGSRDETIILWDVTTRQQVGPPLRAQASQGVNSLGFSPDGKILASGYASRAIILWDVATRRPLSTSFAGHTDGVNSVAFSPDGKTLASGSFDQTIILWDVATRQRLGQPLAGHTGSVRGLAFSPDGKTLASGSDDKSIILWDVDPESWKARACKIAGRNFTREEWQLYLPGEPYRKTCPQWLLEPEATPTPKP